MTFCWQIGGGSGAYVLYDTFSFKHTLPPASNKIEFCVCFRADGKEFWDNNDVSVTHIHIHIHDDVPCQCSFVYHLFSVLAGQKLHTFQETFELWKPVAGHFNADGSEELQSDNSGHYSKLTAHGHSRRQIYGFNPVQNDLVLRVCILESFREW